MKVYLPKINITINKELDVNITTFFAEEKGHFVLQTLPDIKNMGQKERKTYIKKYINDFYINSGDKIKQKINYLQNSGDKLISICEVLTDIVGYNWQGYQKIVIHPSFCPIAPRFLRKGSFMVPISCREKYLLKLCAHELTHFIYFKKWHQIFHDKWNDYEFPHPTWVLSEILVVIIANDQRIKNITKIKEDFYPHWRKIVKKYKLNQVFYKIYQDAENFENFLQRARSEYFKLDKKYKLSKQLTDG